MQANDDNLIWIDLEMTGLDTDADSILEMATIVTDKELNILAEGPVFAIRHEIDRLESDADRVMRSAMSKLFREEKDVRELIKLKAVYELLESISDRCEDVANLIEGVVLENS